MTTDEVVRMGPVHRRHSVLAECRDRWGGGLVTWQPVQIEVPAPLPLRVRVAEAAPALGLAKVSSTSETGGRQARILGHPTLNTGPREERDVLT